MFHRPYGRFMFQVGQSPGFIFQDSCTRASDVGYIDNETAKRLYNDCLNLSKSIAKFIASLRMSPITGLKNLPPET
jgi:hypothetical protein